MGSRGRRSATYRKVRAEFQTGRYLCHICGKRPGVTIDHVPPLSAFDVPEAWQGEYRPACKPCQNKQGADITNRKHKRWQY